eukprot:3912298-Pyramimonas_sp.AAC.1
MAFGPSRHHACGSFASGMFVWMLRGASRGPFAGRFLGAVLGPLGAFRGPLGGLFGPLGGLLAGASFGA